MEDQMKELPKQNNSKTVLALICIIILFLVLLFVTFSYFTNPRRLVVSDIEKMYSKITEYKSNQISNTVLNNDIVQLEGTADIEVTGADQVFDAFRNIQLKYNYIEDKTKSRSSLDFSSTINQEEFLTVEGLNEDDIYYIKLKNLIDKFYYTNINFESILNQTNSTDLIYIGDIIKETLIENITNDKFEKTNEEITVNDKTVKTNKITFNFDDKLISKIIQEIVNKIKADNKALTILSEQMKIEKEEVKTSLDDIVEAISTEENNKYSYNIYVQNYVKTVKREIEINNYKLEYYEDGNNSQIKLIVDSQEMIDLKLNTETKTISGTINDMEIKGNYTDNSLTLNIGYMTQTIDLEIKLNNKLEDADNYKQDIEMNIIMSENALEMVNIKIDSKNTFSKVEEIDDKDVSEAIDINEISPEDRNIMMEKIYNLPIIRDLISFYNSQMNIPQQTNLNGLL